MTQNVQTEEAIRDLIDGNTANVEKLLRDGVVTALGAVVASGANYLAGFGLPPEVTMYVGAAVGLFVYRVARRKGWLEPLGVSRK